MSLSRRAADVYDLDVIHQAYGPDADLCADVLRVSYSATDAQIQSAFFDRRSEIFTVLSKLNRQDESDDDEIALSQRRFAERRMDAVVMAFRVLKKPALRKGYDQDRERRIAKRTADALKNQSDSSMPMHIDPQLSPTAVQSFDELIRPIPFDEDSTPRKKKQVRGNKIRPVNLHVEQLSGSSRRKSRSPNKSMDTDQTHVEESEDSVTDERERRSDRETSHLHDDDYEEVPRRRKKKEGVMEKINESPFVRTIAEEVHGAYLDTLTAFDQVLNAFTLQEKDIDAVCGRIEKAKKQLGSVEE